MAVGQPCRSVKKSSHGSGREAYHGTGINNTRGGRWRCYARQYQAPAAWAAGSARRRSEHLQRGEVGGRFDLAMVVPARRTASATRLDDCWSRRAPARGRAWRRGRGRRAPSDKARGSWPPRRAVLQGRTGAARPKSGKVSAAGSPPAKEIMLAALRLPESPGSATGAGAVHAGGEGERRRSAVREGKACLQVVRAEFGQGIDLLILIASPRNVNMVDLNRCTSCAEAIELFCYRASPRPLTVCWKPGIWAGCITGCCISWRASRASP